MRGAKNLLILFLIGWHPTSAQMAKDTLHYKHIFSLALKRDITQVLQILDTIQLYKQEDIDFKKLFELRFKYARDSTHFAKEVPENIKPLYQIFREYWRRSLLNKNVNYDNELKTNLIRFLSAENKHAKFTDAAISEASLEDVYMQYIRSKGLHATYYGKTGFLYDLIMWKEMNSAHYSVGLIDDTVNVKVNFIDDFVSLGWLSYARMGRSSPGGWATKEELYCVIDGYDTTSEKFKTSYLKHEGQHFSDYHRYDSLPAADLEYRAKLVELYFSNETQPTLVESFIRGAKYDTSNSHPFANYCVIRDLSRILFNSGFEQDFDRWKRLPRRDIARAAKQVYLLYSLKSLRSP